MILQAYEYERSQKRNGDPQYLEEFFVSTKGILRLVDWSIDWLIDWLVVWLIDWLMIGRLIDWLVGCLLGLVRSQIHRTNLLEKCFFLQENSRIPKWSDGSENWWNYGNRSTPPLRPRTEPWITQWPLRRLQPPLNRRKGTRTSEFRGRTYYLKFDGVIRITLPICDTFFPWWNGRAVGIQKSGGWIRRFDRRC